MSLSPSQHPEQEPQYCLPLFISNNPRSKVLPEEISSSDIVKCHKRKAKKDATLVWNPITRPVPLPTPKLPLSIAWSPERMCFEIFDNAVEKQLRIWNSSTHSIYIQYCGLWDESARLGAGWRSQPYTRFLLAPGLVAILYVHATPRETSPIPLAYAALQLAASHKRDNVVGYFMVPIHIKFGKYVEPHFGE